jgi:hypothetical protein
MFCLPAGFRREYFNQFRPIFQNVLDPRHNVLGLEWLAVVLPDVGMRSDARLGSQMASELTALVVLDDNDAPALAKDRADFGAVEGRQELDLQMVG